MPRYTIGDHSKSETQHNQIYGGALAFSFAPRSFTIYVSYILNASGVKTGVLHSPPPSIALSSVLYKIEQNSTLVPTLVLHRFEQKWMCHFHGILKLPCSLFRTVVLPLHLYLSYGSVSEHGDFPIKDVHWLDSEISLGFHLNHIPIYHMFRVMYIFLKQRNMKNIMIPSARRKCKSICN